jgi:hypothetical protein
LPIATVIWTTAATALVLVECPIDVIEWVEDELFDIVMLDWKFDTIINIMNDYDRDTVRQTRPEVGQVG